MKHLSNLYHFRSLYGLPKRLIFNQFASEALHVAENVIKAETQKENPFERPDWREFVRQVKELTHKSPEQLMSDMKTAAAQKAQALIDQVPSVKDFPTLSQAAKEGVKSYLAGLSASMVGYKAEALAAEAYGGLKKVKKSVKVLEGSGKLGKFAPLDVDKLDFVDKIGKGERALALMQVEAETAALIKSGVCTAEQALSLGLKIESISPTAAFLAKLPGLGLSVEAAKRISYVVKIGGKFVIVLTAAEKIYKAYKEYAKLAQLLESDGGFTMGAVVSVAQHTPEMDRARMQTRDSEERAIMREKDPDKYLEGARLSATRLIIDAADYGRSIIGTEKAKYGFWESIDHGIDYVGGMPTFLMAADSLGGTADEKTHTVEKAALQNSIVNCKGMLSALEQIMAPSPERNATISALRRAIGLAEAAIFSDKPVDQKDTEEGLVRIHEAAYIALKGRLKRGAEKMLIQLKEAASTSMGDNALEQKITTFQQALAATKTPGEMRSIMLAQLKQADSTIKETDYLGERMIALAATKASQEMRSVLKSYDALNKEVAEFLSPLPKVVPEIIKSEVRGRLKDWPKSRNLSGDITHVGTVYHFEYRASDKSTTITPR